NLKDAGDPVELAAYYDKQGADELVFLDITASSDKRYIMHDVVRKVAEKIYIPFTVGGGINDVETMRKLLAAGADKISVNTAAVADPNLVKKGADKFGSQCVVVAIDAKRVASSQSPVASPKWEVYTHGGRTPTGLDVLEWVRKVEGLGAGEILLTSMDCDGTKNGYDLELTRSVSEAVNIPVIASGGAGNLEHLYEAFQKGKADAVLAASIFHYREFTLNQAKKYLTEKGIHIRH
ncbi:MAG: imidazole glycerol phosphate synthase subunit HisF, partial [bacterium]